MAIYTDIVAPVAIMLLTGYLGTWMHEGIHYITARIWSTDVEFAFFYFIPHAVDMSNADLPEKAIRFVAVAPLLIWSLPLGLLTVFVTLPLIQSVYWHYGLALLMPLVALILSPGDFLALFFPSAWKQRYEQRESTKMSHREDLKFLFREIYATLMSD